MSRFSERSSHMVHNVNFTYCCNLQVVQQALIWHSVWWQSVSDCDSLYAIFSRFCSRKNHFLDLIDSEIIQEMAPLIYFRIGFKISRNVSVLWALLSASSHRMGRKLTGTESWWRLKAVGVRNCWVFNWVPLVQHDCCIHESDQGPLLIARSRSLRSLVQFLTCSGYKQSQQWTKILLQHSTLAFSSTFWSTLIYFVSWPIPHFVLWKGTANALKSETRSQVPWVSSWNFQLKCSAWTFN